MVVSYSYIIVHDIFIVIQSHLLLVCFLSLSFSLSHTNTHTYLYALIRLNLPKCLPDVYLEMKDPHPISKGILSDLFGSGRGHFDSEALCKLHMICHKEVLMYGTHAEKDS